MPAGVTCTSGSAVGSYAAVAAVAVSDVLGVVSGAEALVGAEAEERTAKGEWKARVAAGDERAMGFAALVRMERSIVLIVVVVVVGVWEKYSEGREEKEGRRDGPAVKAVGERIRIYISLRLETVVERVGGEKLGKKRNNWG